MEIEKAVSSILQKIQGYSKSLLLIALDGRCGAGKTTLAARLQEKTGCNIIHMDHFFLQPEQRSRERLEEPGGNVDYERFLEEVMIPLSRGQKSSYRIYDCKTGTLSEPVSVEPNGMIVVEGSYSCHPRFWDFYDFRIFMDVEEEEQLRRIGLRSGEEALARFRERWIPLEERYFAAYQIQERCDFNSYIKCNKGD